MSIKSSIWLSDKYPLSAAAAQPNSLAVFWQLLSHIFWLYSAYQTEWETVN